MWQRSYQTKIYRMIWNPKKNPWKGQNWSRSGGLRLRGSRSLCCALALKCRHQCIILCGNESAVELRNERVNRQNLHQKLRESVRCLNHRRSRSHPRSARRPRYVHRERSSPPPPSDCTQARHRGTDCFLSALERHIETASNSHR